LLLLLLLLVVQHLYSVYNPKFHLARHVTSRYDSTRSTCRARQDERVEPRCSTSWTQPKCMGSTRRTCRVVSRRGVTSQVEYGLVCTFSATRRHSAFGCWSESEGQATAYCPTDRRCLTEIRACSALPSSCDCRTCLPCGVETICSFTRSRTASFYTGWPRKSKPLSREPPVRLDF